jgi:hypothetical protein
MHVNSIGVTNHLFTSTLAARKEPGDLFVYFVMDLGQESMPSGPLLACHSASESAKSGLLLSVSS